MKSGACGVVIRLADRMEPKEGLDRVLTGFFRTAAVTEADWFAEGVLQVERTGDVFLAKVRLHEGMNRFKGIAEFGEKVAPAAERLAAQELKPLLRAGEVFYRVVSTKQEEAQRYQAMGQYRQAYRDTIYAEAFKAVMEDPEKKTTWSDYFLARNPDARDHQYPPPLNGGKK
jgi:hypothetical protein